MIVLPEIISPHGWQRVLHNQRGLFIKRLLLFEERVILASVPYRVPTGPLAAPSIPGEALGIPAPGAPPASAPAAMAPRRRPAAGAEPPPRPAVPPEPVISTEAMWRLFEGSPARSRCSQ